MDPACVTVPVESPVPGVSIELASLLVNAIKARRKFLSKSSSTPRSAGDAEKLQGLNEAANDKTSAFLNELRRAVDRSSESGSKSSSRRKRSPPNAPTCCVEFLLGITSDSSNSFHLRRSALALIREILERSSDARAFLASGQCLLDFVSVIEGAENDHSQEEEGNAEGSTMTPQHTFQLEAMELVHHLASKFGKFYTQFTVASRLLGDVSTNLSIHNTDSNNSSGGGEERQRSRRVNMRTLRRQRDIALESGPKACLSLERMIERADGYFRILVPRFGGFNVETVQHLDGLPKSDELGDADSKLGAASTPDGEKKCADHDDEEDEDDSIDWEEGDVDLSGHDNFDEYETDAHADFHNDTQSEQLASEDHETAVEQTLDIMGRGGALLDGQLAVQVDSGNSVELGTAGLDAAALESAPSSHPDVVEARKKLKNVVEKLSVQRLPRLNQWIHALSHADGMEERAVLDPAAAGEGPVSLVLLSEEKRKLRGKLLQRMMKIRKEIESVLDSAAKIIRNDNLGAVTSATDEVRGTSSLEAAGTKRSHQPTLSGDDNFTVARKKKKKKIDIIYAKR